MLLYIAQCAADDPKMGAIKRNKVMYFAELDHVRRVGRPITAASYQKLAHGQALRRMKPIERKLVDEGAAVRFTSDEFDDRVDRLRAMRDPDLTMFNDSEIASIDKAIEEAWDDNATQIRERAHEDIGWLAVEMKQDIPWELAFARIPDVTDEIRERARDLAKKAGS